jgi:hypothetical protein
LKENFASNMIRVPLQPLRIWPRRAFDRFAFTASKDTVLLCGFQLTGRL